MRAFFLFASFLLLMSCFANAQTRPSRDQQAVESAVAQLRKALIDPDRSTLESLVTDELSYGHSNGLLEDKATFVEALLSKKSDFVTIDLTDQTITVLDNTAMVRHKFDAETLSEGVKGQAKLAVLTVWVKQRDQWKLFARQAVKR